MNTRSTETVIEINDLVSHYGERKILDGVGIQIYRGEIFVIMGASGAGKSTLFKHLLGLKKPSSGSIRILDKEISLLDKKGLYKLRRNIGVAFQGGALFSSMSVAENVQLPLREHTELDPATIEIMTRMKLEMMNLAGFEHLMPSELSGGMRKRAGLARAVIMDPKILFFDEPSSGLDPVSSAELDELILQLRDALRMTIVIVTHELESAFKVADRITILGRGRALMTGTVEEVKRSEDPLIQGLLRRQARRESVDADAYLKRLTGN